MKIQIKKASGNLASLLCMGIFCTSTQAEVSLSKMFSNNMILQRELPVPLYGKADAGEKVSVEFAGQNKQTVADKDGNWQVVLDPLKTSKEGLTITVKGTNTIELNKILVGEVWLCAGQSNMAGTFGEKHGHIEDEHFEKGLSQMRILSKNSKTWEPLDKRSQNRLSRVAFYFGVELYRELDIPIGLITRHNGGTPMQAWMSATDAEVIRKKLNIPENWREEDKKQRAPGYQYEHKLKEIIPFTFRGAIWYQGERNAKSNTALEYDHITRHFIDSWRKDWGERAGLKTRKFPFYYVQIPTDIHLRNYEFPWVRDRQRRALDITENTGMAIFWEEGPGLHPKKKQLAGKRLSLIALAKDYGRTDLVYSGPLLKDVEYKEGKAILSFKHIGGGLREKNGENKLKYFEIAGDDVKYQAAEAWIEGDKVIVKADSVPHPKYVRYLFNANPKVQESQEGADEDEGAANWSLINVEGIPASSFMTDN